MKGVPRTPATALSLCRQAHGFRDGLVGVRGQIPACRVSLIPERMAFRHVDRQQQVCRVAGVDEIGGYALYRFVCVNLGKLVHCGCGRRGNQVDRYRPRLLRLLALAG